MITELMIILIVVGAIIIFVAWTSTRKRKRNEDDRKDTEESTEKFKNNLEKTANEIIGRMEEQAARLEKLLKESERSRTQTEGRISELKKLARTTELQAAELKEFLARLENAVDDVNAIRNAKPARTPVSTRISPKSSIAPPPAPRTPTSNFATVLEQSLAEPAPQRKSEHLARRTSELPTTGADFKSDTPTAADSAEVREMLAAGMTVEEIARQTGLGRGAILLVQQMMRHRNERR